MLIRHPSGPDPEPAKHSQAGSRLQTDRDARQRQQPRRLDASDLSPEGKRDSPQEMRGALRLLHRVTDRADSAGRPRAGLLERSTVSRALVEQRELAPGDGCAPAAGPAVALRRHEKHLQSLREIRA